jgi:hypothetical protein
LPIRAGKVRDLMKNIYPSEVVRFIDEVFPWAGRGLEAQKPQLRLDQLSHIFGALVELVDQIEPELLPANEHKRAQLLVATTQIRELIRAGRSGLVPFLPKETYGIGPSDPVSYIRDALANLPDQAVPKSITTLIFLNDSELAEALRADIATASSALRNGEWKAAAVLSGSVIEALLLWALQKAHTTMIQAQAIGPKKPLEQWGLAAYIDAAEKFRCIGSNTLTEVRRAQDYRNLIHPGRATRLGIQCDLGAAHIAIGALDHVINDLRTGRNHSH